MSQTVTGKLSAPFLSVDEGGSSISMDFLNNDSFTEVSLGGIDKPELRKTKSTQLTPQRRESEVIPAKEAIKEILELPKLVEKERDRSRQEDSIPDPEIHIELLPLKRSASSRLPNESNFLGNLTLSHPNEAELDLGFAPPELIEKAFDWDEIEEERPRRKSSLSPPQFTSLSERIEYNRKKLVNLLSKVGQIQSQISAKPASIDPSLLSSSESVSRLLLSCFHCKKSKNVKLFRCVTCENFISCVHCETLSEHPHLMIRLPLDCAKNQKNSDGN